MQRLVPTDDYRAALARARLRARTQDADANEQEAEALVVAADALRPDARLAGPAAAVAKRQLDQLQARAVALDSGDLRFRDEADSLWDDVQDYAFRMGAQPPVRFTVAPAESDAPTGDTLGGRMVYDARQARAAGRAGATVDHRALAAFALRNLMAQRPARSVFHRRLEARALLAAASTATPAQPAKDAGPAPKPAPSGAGAADAQGGSHPEPQGDAAVPPRRRPVVVRPDDPDQADVEVEIVEVDDVDDDGADPGAEDVGALLARALPDADPREVDDLVAAFRAAGIETRADVAELASDRSVARESGDALRRGVGARLGLDRDEAYARLRDRAVFIAIARAARWNPEAA